MYLDGKEVPFLQVTSISDKEISISLDRRFGYTVPKEQFTDFIWFLAQAIAIAGGNPSFGYLYKEMVE